MTGTAPRPLWRGRTVALLGILLLALNLRTAVAALSPIVEAISADIPLDSLALGIMASMPPVTFALAAIIAPPLARRITLERSLVVAALAMIAGLLVRSLAPGYPVLLGGTFLALMGMGIGNVLLPPIVKKYFPDRIGAVTTAYVTLLAIGTALPPLFAVPIADLAGWRVSLGVWTAVAFAAAIPWIIAVAQHRRETKAQLEAEVPVPAAEIVGRMWHSRVAWALLMAFAVSALNAYAFFTWLPSLLVQNAGMSVADAGLMLGIYSLLGLPASLLVPSLAVRMRNVGWLIGTGAVLFWVAYAGLLLIPGTLTVVWVVLAGLGPIMFQACLVLFNLRTRTPATSAALSGFVQSGGYLLAAAGPLIVGLLHDVTDGWTVPLIFLSVTVVPAMIAAVILAKPRFVEDEIAERGAR